MSSQGERPPRSAKTTIHSLPEEVMCMIFDWLDIYGVKFASLTCHRWNNIIFMSNYVSRFKLKLDRNKDGVTKSKRCYRNVVWFINDQDSL
ncbi:uncharacterized protein LOC125956447 isoform X2 [Anopheles darlingi]|uniref:uncharacterized protein LOC125956447 isoform X2 n=1 Tax=Anopheles darlingi TaxID=43151 RepID=UPI00210053A7|nr:uncharacterized protein LOC125956447 isoform X2 [Anopheles darlingi]